VAGDWSNDDIVRALERMDDTLKEMRTDQRAANDRMVPRESWEMAMTSLKEWKGQVSAQVIDASADVGRLRTEMDARFEKEAAKRTSAVRWAVGIAVPTILTVVGMVIGALTGG